MADVQSWLDAVRDAERRGELLAAVDLAERGLAEHPESLWLKYRSALALARAGATQGAAERFERYGLGASAEEDIAALAARIAKDNALAKRGESRRREALRARDLYEQVFRRTGGYYPAVNAATLSLMGGDPHRSRELARVVLNLIESGASDTYYAAASEAEAQLLLHDENAAGAALDRAAALHGGDDGALATTRRQLRLVCALTGSRADLLLRLAGPTVVHYCGHRIAERGRFAASAEADVAARIRDETAKRTLGYAYGSLASGADILWAEAFLARGAELHVVLPFAIDEFVENSVAPAGRDWIDRFHRCLDAAVAVTYATEDAFLDDDVLYRYGSELAMGLALLRARFLDAETVQFAVWDGAPAHGDAGTAIDVGTWTARGKPVVVVDPCSESASSAAVTSHRRPRPRRTVRSLLFGDFKDFSKLTDEQLPRFAEHVLAALARVLDRYGDSVLHRNSWGDALYAVLDKATDGAACAMDLQASIAALDLAALGLPDHLALRLGGHVGPVFPISDPISRQLGFMGSHVSRTARLEPVTPPGEVYVTQHFAAALELDGDHPFACDYVGHMPAAKSYGHLRMYRLRHRT
jgi:hypothetical protein